MPRLTELTKSTVSIAAAKSYASSSRLSVTQFNIVYKCTAFAVVELLEYSLIVENTKKSNLLAIPDPDCEPAFLVIWFKPIDEDSVHSSNSVLCIDTKQRFFCSSSLDLVLCCSDKLKCCLVFSSLGDFDSDEPFTEFETKSLVCVDFDPKHSSQTCKAISSQCSIAFRPMAQESNKNL